VKARHRTKAIVGVGLWFALLLVYVAVVIASRLTRDGERFFRPGPLIIIAILTGLAQYVCYFWGGHHLTKGRGQSGGFFLLGALGPPAQFIVFIVILSLPDHHEPHTLPRSRARKRND